MNDAGRPKAARRRGWLGKVGIALAILLMCPVALWLVVGWGPFAPELIEPDQRFFLAKAAKPEVSVYECGKVPGTKDDAPPEDLSEPCDQMTPDAVVWARVLPMPDEAGNRWAEVHAGCVRLEDVVPATADDCGVPVAPGARRLMHVRYGGDPFSCSAQAWYGTRDEPVIFLYWADRCAFYRVQRDGQVEWLIARWLYHEAGFRAGVYVWPRQGDIDGVPDVLLYQPPLGLACFRWDGKSSRPSLPTLRQFGELVYLVVRGAPGPAALGWLLLTTCWFVWASFRTVSRMRADPWSADDQMGVACGKLALTALVIVLLTAAVLAFCLLWAICIDEAVHDPPFHVP